MLNIDAIIKRRNARRAGVYLTGGRERWWGDGFPGLRVPGSIPVVHSLVDNDVFYYLLYILFIFISVLYYV